MIALSSVCGGPFFGEVLAGVAQELARVGGHLVAVQTLDTGRTRDDLLASSAAVPIGWADADGAIAITNAVQSADLERLRHQGTPVVLVSGAVEGFASVTPDNVGGIRSAVAHLAEHGHTRIGFVANLVQSDLRERHAAYLSAMEEFGLAAPAQLFFPASDNGEVGGRDAGGAIVAAGVPLTAVVAGTDRNAIGVLDALSAAGVRVPDDVAVVGFDDIDRCRLTEPTLSSVSQHFDEMGALAGRLLFDEIAGRPRQRYPHRGPSAFVARRSCGCIDEDIPAHGQPDGNALAHDSETAARQAAARWETYARTYLARTAEHDQTLLEHYDVGLRLLGQGSAEPRRLDWMAATRARAGCLGLWEGPPEGGRLRIVGTYDAEQQPVAGLGDVLPVEQFPPRALVRRADTRAGEITFVIPVRLDGADWGLLALVGAVDTHSASARETYNQWAALLAAALAREGLHDGIRRSEERYSLVAEATNDGLWDWPLDQDSIYYSARCLEMLGSRREAGAAAAAQWFDSVHPDDLETLRQALAAAASGERHSVEVEHRVRGVDGEYRYVLCRAMGVADAGHIVRLVGSLADVDQRKQLEERLRQAALFDEVTGLPNRKLFLERLSLAIAQARRSPEFAYAVLFLDLDGFKLVNDSLGHPAGDELLSCIGSRLRLGVRDVDLVARFGGDEFAVLLHNVDLAALPTIVEHLQDQLTEPISLDGHEIVVTASIGITTSELGYTNPEDALSDADVAMYRAKSLQRGSHIIFDSGMHDDELACLTLGSGQVPADRPTPTGIRLASPREGA